MSTSRWGSLISFAHCGLPLPGLPLSMTQAQAVCAGGDKERECHSANGEPAEQVPLSIGIGVVLLKHESDGVDGAKRRHYDCAAADLFPPSRAVFGRLNSIRLRLGVLHDAKLSDFGRDLSLSVG